MDNKLFSCGIFIDLKKAFDTVDHDILLCKLKYYSIRGVVNDWFSSDLKNRSQWEIVYLIKRRPYVEYLRVLFLDLFFF